MGVAKLKTSLINMQNISRDSSKKEVANSIVETTPEAINNNACRLAVLEERSVNHAQVVKDATIAFNELKYEVRDSIKEIKSEIKTHDERIKKIELTWSKIWGGVAVFTVVLSVVFTIIQIILNSLLK